MSQEQQPLAGRRIAAPETRELDLFAKMLESEGAAVVRCPLVAILDAPDPAPIEAWLQKLIDGQFDDLVLYTGEGLRRLLGFAERAGIDGAVKEALAKVRKVTRGPKPARALREIGLAPDLVAKEPTTEGIVATLAEHGVSGRRMGVQLYAAEAPAALAGFLQFQGVVTHYVTPYYYAPASDAQRVVELIDELAAGQIDAIAFTSASQVDRLWEVASKHQREPQLADGLARTQVAAVGPVVADSLRGHGARVDVVPEDRFFMRPLVNAIVASFQRQK